MPSFYQFIDIITGQPIEGQAQPDEKTFREIAAEFMENYKSVPDPIIISTREYLELKTLYENRNKKKSTKSL